MSVDKKKVEEILTQIQLLMVESMKDDLNDPDKRTPQLYNSIIKELERNGINVVIRAGEDADNPMMTLLKSVKSHYSEDYGEPN